MNLADSRVLIKRDITENSLEDVKTAAAENSRRNVVETSKLTAEELNTITKIINDDDKFATEKIYTEVEFQKENQIQPKKKLLDPTEIPQDLELQEKEDDGKASIENMILEESIGKTKYQKDSENSSFMT